jgi:hypothetical protein
MVLGKLSHQRGNNRPGMIPAHNIPAFKPAKSFAAKVK